MVSFTDIANPWVKDIESYEPGRPIAEVARELGFESADDIIKLASNENALGPSPLAVKAMKKGAAQMHRYPDGGAYYLKQALARKLNVKPGQLLPANGSNEILELMGHVFLGPNVGIVMAECAFVVYRLIAASFQADVVAVPMKDFTHDLDAMLEAIEPETRIVFISNPNNPTSTMVDEKAIDRFMDKVPDHVVVCFDEAYIELLPPEKQPDTLKHIRTGQEKVILLRTFSKTYGLAGLRIGYAIAPEDCISLLNRARQPFNVNAMAMEAAIAALEDDGYVDRTREMIREGLTYLRGEFDRMGLRYVPAVANFILVEVGCQRSAAAAKAMAAREVSLPAVAPSTQGLGAKAGGQRLAPPQAGSGVREEITRGPSTSLRTGRKVAEALEHEGVIVRPMDCYGLPGHVRVTVGTQEENERLVKALGNVMKCMGTSTIE